MSEAIETLKVESEVTKETYEVCDALAEVVKNTKQALADGFQPGQDIPAVVLGSFNKFAAGLDGFMKMPAEAKGNTPAFIQGVGVGLGKVGAELAK